MAPIVHIVRHAEGFHNTAKFGEGIHDPFLTENGKEQCRELCRKFKHHDEIELLMASPMKRTIQTCQIGFQPCVDRGMKILLMPLAQENSDEQMDIGSTEEEIKAAFGELVDTQRLEKFPYWTRKTGRFGTDAKALIERARQLRCVLRERPEKQIVLVSHGTFAHFVAGNVSKEGEQTTRMWSNAECRSYSFEGEDAEAKLVETEESCSLRPDLEKQDSGNVWTAAA